MKKAVNSGMFKGFAVGPRISMDIIQFADDTLIIGKGGWQNLWSMKSILRGFRILSGLKANFYKIRLMGLNVSDHFLLAASNFLSYIIDCPSFSFLGIPIGCNPRRVKT
ncbi:unnamed protein product [Lathyrus sativus]|nr:unnamed protein product [Lathyrus sativus]